MTQRKHQIFRSDLPFNFENGATLPGITVAYHTFGTLNATGSNVVWVCHALTANADVLDWWPGVVGPGCTIDPSKYFIVCANIIGSCYGSSGPATAEPGSAAPLYINFPPPTVRDMVQAFILLRRHLGIEQIHLLMGGSMGGYQVLEWALAEPAKIQHLFLIATSPAESAWGHAIHAAQRMAIETDTTWKDATPEAGTKGLEVARAIGMLTYRNYTMLVQKQHDNDVEKIESYKAESYMRYQGRKLAKRFHAQSYWMLTKAMDSHNIARGRGGDVAAVLATIQQPTLIIGIDSDILCPLEEQQFMADHIATGKFVVICSDYGHDGFLIEAECIGGYLEEFLRGI